MVVAVPAVAADDGALDNWPRCPVLYPTYDPSIVHFDPDCLMPLPGIRP